MGALACTSTHSESPTQDYAARPITAACRHLFVVPAFNEAANLPRLLADLESRPGLFPAGSRLIVVDDGSADGTAELAESHAGSITVEVVRMGTNQGPGAAFRAGFAAALAHCDSDEEALVITLEADTTSNLDSLPTMIAQARTGAHVVLAAWQMVNVSTKRRLLSRGAGFVIRRMLGVDAHTVSSFYRVYRASALRAAAEHYGDKLIRESGFACKAEILAKLNALHMTVAEVNVELDSTRRIGESTMPIGKTIVAYWRMMARQIVSTAPETR
jgi:dolichol-phosphate mannosyltransferase